MRTREIVAKLLAFLLVGAGFAATGILVLGGNQATGDWPPAGPVGWGLVGIGVLIAVGGLGLIAMMARTQHVRDDAHNVHLTPRAGAPAAPPAWGMGDIGRPGQGIVEVGRDVPSGGGSVRLMSVHASNLDAPLVIGALLIWTVVALFLLAPK